MSDFLALTRASLRELRRRPFLLALLVIIPILFIPVAIAKTEPIPRIIGLPGGQDVLTTMRAIHGATMAAVAIGLLSGLCGVFIIDAARSADRRLVVAGIAPRVVVATRLATLAVSVAIVVVVSLSITAVGFSPTSWLWFVVGSALVGITYGAIGAVAGALVGRLGATWILLLGAFLELGVVQSPMFGSGTPDGWAVVTPAYGAMRVIIDAAFASRFIAWGELSLALLWVVLVVAGAGLVLSHALGIKRAPARLAEV